MSEDLYDLKGLPGDGNTEMVLFPDKGRVIVRYREPRLWVAFDPSNAVQVGKRIIDCAVECGANVVLQVPKRKITEEQRKRLTVRATHVFRSMQEQGRSPAAIARNVVDTILSAID